MTYSKDIIFDAQQLLETICPVNLLLIGSSIESIANNYISQCESIHRSCYVNTIDASNKLSHDYYNQRYDLVIIADLLESCSKQHAQQLLAKTRNLCSPKVILLATLNDQWSKNELLALGLIQFAEYTDPNRQENLKSVLYQYNIDTYKKTPDWFSPKNWANPELWDKFWW